MGVRTTEVGLSKTLKPMSGFTSRTTCSEDAPSLVLLQCDFYYLYVQYSIYTACTCLRNVRVQSRYFNFMLFHTGFCFFSLYRTV